MLNKDLIYNRIDMIKRSLARLRKMTVLSREQFLADPDNFAIAEHHLRRALESLFNIGRHIMAKQGLGHPVDYRSIILTLGREKILPAEFAERIKGMAGYRNRLVHGYAEVTPEEMYDIMQHRLADFENYCTYILKYLEKV
ncbi:type VII toxin-antitoxin system HepT family RNase toxin [Desulfofundulus sp.]|uniref:type VII toxin-antitoxin system HepT family RNase toxin n=1 Tax=Desulfofundulus sp. TaxID=2282750 RepID=UPI003C70E78C